MKALVRGIGWVTAAGLGRGRDGCAFSMPAGELPHLKRRDVFAEPYNRFGRLDDFSRLGLSGIALALQDAGLDQWGEKRDIGVIASTRFGCLPTDLAYFDTVIPDEGALASPNLFAYTLSNTFLGEAAIRFGLTGTGFVLNEDDSQRLGALRMALESLAWEECATVVAGCCDLPAPEELRLGKPAPAGAVFLVLEKGTIPPTPGRRIELAMARDGSMAVDGTAATGWAEMVQACLGTMNTSA